MIFESFFIQIKDSVFLYFNIVLALPELVDEAYKVKYYVTESTEKQDLIYLSVFVSSHNFQYAIFTDDYKTVVEMADVEFKDAHLPEYNPIDLVSLLVNNNFLNQKKFQKVNISILNNQFTLVPDSFAEEANMNSLLHFTTGVNELCKSYKHKTKQCNFCYTLPNDWLDYFSKTFPQASIRHSGAVNISLIFEQFSLIHSQLFICIHQSQLEISVKHQNQLLFYNVFSYESKEDILYYILFVMEQLELNPLLCKLCLACEIETSDDLIKSIKKYVKFVEFSVFDKSITFKNKDAKLPGHYYFTLLNQHLCEL